MKVTMTELLARGAAIGAVIILAAGAAIADVPVTYQSNATLASAFCAEDGCGDVTPGCGVAADSSVGCGDPCDAGCTTCDCCYEEGLLSRSARCCGGLLSDGAYYCGGLLSNGASYCGGLLSDGVYYGGGLLSDGVYYGEGLLSGGARCCEGLMSGCLGLLDGDEPYNNCSDSFLCGLFAPTDTCYNDFISPMTNPTFFEDPRTLSEVRLIFLTQKVPLAAGGGDMQVYGLQARAAINDRVSILLTKAGYVTADSPFVGYKDGWADIAAGLKVNLMKDPVEQRLLSAGFTFEFPSGTEEVLQGNGDGVLNLFGTYGRQVGYDAHWLSAIGVAVPMDDDDESTLFYWSNHLDYRLGGGFYVLGEVNWYNYLRAGTGGIPGMEGGDLVNLGSSGVAGNDIVTAAIGLKAKPYDDMEVGVAWEAPVTDRRDVLDNRLTVDVIFRY